MATLWQDLSFAARGLRRRPGVTLVALTTLAIGIGSAAAIFSVVHAVLMRPLPYLDESRIVMIWETEPANGVDKKTGTPGNFQDWRDRNRTVDHLSGISQFDATLTGWGEPRRLDGRRVGVNIFSALGVSPLHGRAFDNRDEHAGDVVLLSHRLWRQMFGADPLIVGQRLTLNDRGYTIVGVMPPQFRLPRGVDDFWVPMILSSWERQARGSHWLMAVGRLKPGVSRAQAQADFDVIAQGLATAFPRFNAHEGLLVEPIRDEMAAGLRRPLGVLMAAVMIVMAIASINVANLLLARASDREHEMRVRLALGASRRRLAQQLFTESAMLATIGTVSGLLLAWLATRALISTLPAELAAVPDIALNIPVLMFAAAIAFASTVVSGVAPMTLLSRHRAATLPDTAHRSTSPHLRRTRRVLVTAEIAFAVVLLIAGGLLIRSFVRLSTVVPGFRSDSVLTFAIELPRSRYPDPSRWSPMLDQLMARLQSLPSVSSAGAVSWLPLTFNGGSNALFVEGRPLPSAGEQEFVVYRLATPGYFRTLSIPLIAGRTFDQSDVMQSPKVVVINQTLANRHWRGESPIGRRVTFARAPREEDWMTIVGVVGDTKQASLSEATDIEMFAPHTQEPNWFPPSHVALRAGIDPMSLAAAVRAAVRDIDPMMPVSDMKPLDEVVSDSVSPQRFNTWIVAAFGVIALALAAVGIYGLLSFSVATRTREIGVRTALGATTGAIVRMVMRDGLSLVLMGFAIGLPAASGVTRLLRTLLYETTPTDPFTFVAIPALLSSVAAIACYLPARRAAAVDPVEAIREG